MKKTDEETKEEISKGQKVADFVSSDEWKIVKANLMSKLIDFDSINNMEMDKKDNTQLVEELRARKGAIEIVLGWIKEIEGISSQHKANLDLFLNEENNGYMERFDEKV